MDCVQSFEEKNVFDPFWNKAVTKLNADKVKHCEYFPNELYVEAEITPPPHFVKGQKCQRYSNTCNVCPTPYFILSQTQIFIYFLR